MIGKEGSERKGKGKGKPRKGKDGKARKGWKVKRVFFIVVFVFCFCDFSIHNR